MGHQFRDRSDVHVCVTSFAGRGNQCHQIKLHYAIRSIFCNNDSTNRTFGLPWSLNRIDCNASQLCSSLPSRFVELILQSNPKVEYLIP